MMIKLIIAAFIIACLAPLFIKGPDGEPLMTLDDWSVSAPAFVTALLDGTFLDETVNQKSLSDDSTPDPASTGEPTEIYKWQDEAGVWHFSDSPVDLGVAEKVELGEVNVMDPWAPETEQETDEPAVTSRLPALPTGSPVTTSQVQEIMDTVTNLQETIDDRKAKMDAIVLPADQNR